MHDKIGLVLRYDTD